MLLTLLDLGLADRDVYLYDTFEGMTAADRARRLASSRSRPSRRGAGAGGGRAAWAWLFGPDAFGEDAVSETVLSTGYPDERVHFVRGAVEETLPGTRPAARAAAPGHRLVRVDPPRARISTRGSPPGGVLIIDDYGHWEGGGGRSTSTSRTGARPAAPPRSTTPAGMGVQALP